ncbi:amino acid permease [Amycolatopsis granulosa]|uniref:amino acid permease n=1 Tax=Amycolatopsis granulosa TaxID=185684 RepID=UPI0014229F68|nr:amino acid permease [Amycolatopsis granulosa]NIH87098.1 GABA permease [Amycolatopsis granulosa]
MSESTSAQPSPPTQGERPRSGSRRERLKNRHVTLLAIGGCIGASLFVGIGEVVRSAGAGAILSYVIGGVIVFFVMRMLGEMATARPDLGSFVDYARESLGAWAGFSVGWMYWYFFVGVIAFEAVVAGQIVGGWLGIPSWICSLVIMVVFVGVNMYSARSFGESEFFLASVKVGTIVVLVVGAVLFVLGLLPGAHFVGVSNLVHAPFLVNGFEPVVRGVVTAVLSYFGTEIAVIASAESEDPGRAVVRTTRLAAWRIVLFFVGSVVALLLVLPFSELPTDSSPFAAAFSRFGIPFSTQLVDVVLLVAVLSIVNSSIYACSRTLFRLSANGWAPASVTTRNRRGVPWRAVLLSGSGGVLGAAINFFASEKAFAFILDSAGAVALIVYAFICLSQLRMRARLSADEVARLPVRMWCHPWFAALCALALVATDVVMLVHSDTRIQAALSLVALAVVLCAYGILAAVRKRARNS